MDFPTFMELFKLLRDYVSTVQAQRADTVDAKKIVAMVLIII